MKRYVTSVFVIGLYLIAGLMISCSSEKEQVSDATLPDTIDFNYHIRPILSQNCFVCHGPDKSSRQADLRLDTEEGATETLASGHRAIVSGSARNSELIKRLRSEDLNEVMPPPESKKTLTAREVALIEKWIDQGAEWKDHWAFISPEVSEKTISRWAEGEGVASSSEKIDFFINEKISEFDLAVTEPASKHALIRRVSYFLTGLPPSNEELNAFLTNDSSEAYEDMIDQYLDSKHFGEHWARHWMDVVRYAEHMGHEFDFAIGGAHHYRDYLIRAFNEDVPYDQFVKEHLAGDLLKEPRVNQEHAFNESVQGTAYAFLGEGKHSPVSIKQEEADRLDNIIDVTSKTFQGLTVACAKCHDHKFDPIPTTDYYAMYGMFESTRIGPKGFNLNSLREAKISKSTVVNSQLNAEVQTLISSEFSKIGSAEILTLKKYIEDSIPSIPIEAKSNIGESDFSDWIMDPQKLKAIENAGIATFDEDDKLVRFDENIISSRTLGKGTMASLRSPTFEVNDSFIVVKAAGHNATIRIIVDNFQLIQNPLYGNLEQRVNSDYWNDFIFNVSNVIGHKAYVEIMPGSYNRHLYDIGVNDYVDVKSVASMAKDPRHEESAVAPLTASVIAEVVNDPIGNMSIDKIKIVNKWLRYKSGVSTNDKIKALSTELNEEDQALTESGFVMGMSEGTEVFSPVFIRGSIDELSDAKVPHQFLAAVAKDKESFSQRGSGRLDWAKAVVDSENPLTSRVMVNRIWHHLFGNGIVKSVDNFGLQGSLPTHPELLDYLAVQFIDDGWSIKTMIKNILLTDAFKRSTSVQESNAAKDPNNDFLHAYPLRRLNAESIRDGVLAITGSLNDSMFGPPVPIYLTEFMNGRGRPSASGPLDGNGRRSVYMSIRRNFLSPMMLAFDMPIPFSTYGKRNTTNVPAQSLTLMNDPFIHDQSRKWASRIIEKDHTTIELRLNELFLTAFARPITPEEIESASSMLEFLRKKAKVKNVDVMKNLELWAEYCHVMINAKEFIHLL